MRMLQRPSPLLLTLALTVGLSMGCSKSYRAQKLINSADLEFQAQHYDAAETQYEAARHLSPLNPAAIRQLGLLYAEEGRVYQAYAFLKKSLELEPNNSLVQLKLSEICLSVGKPEEAAELAAKYLQTDSTSEQALATLAQLSHSAAAYARLRGQLESWSHQNPAAGVYHDALGLADLGQKDLTNAETELQTALRLDPKLPTAYFGMASIYASRHDSNALEKAIKTGAELSPLRSRGRLKFAEYKAQTGALEEAQQFLQGITAQAPDYIPAWSELMKLAFSEQKYDECSAFIAKILARDPSNFEAQLQAGNIALATHKTDEAINQFDRLDALANKKSPQVKYHLGMAYLQKGETAKAAGNLHEALSLDHTFTQAAIVLAEVDLRTGEVAEAITLLTDIIKSHPGEVKPYSLLATAYLSQHRWDQALTVYQQMAKVFPDNASVPYLIGSTYAVEGDHTRARESFVKALEMAPNNRMALEALTELDTSEKRFDEALHRLGAQMEKMPKDASLHMLVANIYLAQGQTNQAEAEFSKSIELNPDAPSPYLALARIYLRSHKEDQALERLNSLIAKTNNAAALMEIAAIQQQKKQFEAARDSYEKLLAISPKFPSALNDYAYMCAENLGNLPRAAELAQQAHDLDPQNPNYNDTLGWILFKQGQYPRALSVLQEAQEKLPDMAEVSMHLGMAYYMMDNEDLALLYLQRALNDPADYPGKEAARQAVAFLSLDPDKATPAIIEELQKRTKDNPRDPVPLTRLAAIEERQGEPAKAAAAYQTLIEQNPKNIQALLKLARLYAGPLKDPRQAMTLAKSAHDLAPSDPHTAALLGDLVYQSGDYSWALTLLQQAATQLTNQPVLLYELAWADYFAGRENEADEKMNDAVAAGPALPNLADAKQFLALRAALKDPSPASSVAAQAQTILQNQPRYLPALMVSALVHRQQGDAKGAAALYEQILDTYPQFSPAMRELAILYVETGDNDAKAYDLAEKARGTRPDDAGLQRALGILAFRRGDFARSKQLLTGAKTQLPGDGPLLYYLGMDYYNLKQRGDSKETLRLALQTNLPDKLAGDARRVLAEMK